MKWSQIEPDWIIQADLCITKSNRIVVISQNNGQGWNLKPPKTQFMTLRNTEFFSCTLQIWVWIFVANACMDFEQIRVWNLNFWRVWHSVGGQKQKWFHSQPQAPNLHILIHHAKKANRQHQNFAFSRAFMHMAFRCYGISNTYMYSMLDKCITCLSPIK